MMKRICLVVQRYGEEITGGSESYCRQIAERLCNYYKVDVLTTKAKDSVTWDNEYAQDVESLNGVTIRRFPTLHSRSITIELQQRTFSDTGDVSDGLEWIESQGPYCPGLVEYLSKNESNYDAIVLVTYLYYPVVEVARKFGKKSLLIPTAHDELCIYQPVFDTVFNNVSGLYYLTLEEKEFVEKRFTLDGVMLGDGNGGVGVVPPLHLDELGFCKIASVGNSSYVLYAGRIDVEKGCKKLLRDFIEYKWRNPSDLKLVLIGKVEIEIPKHPDIVYAGFVSEEEKFSAMKGAVALVQPSHFESLSIVTLEAMDVGTPVLVNGNCRVLKGHCKRSNAGLYYRNYLEFEGMLNYMLSHPRELEAMSINGQKYVEANYRWDSIIEGLRKSIDSVAQKNIP